ncbi:MAG: DUF2064 domain-containing protein [Acidobacteriota bacterium]
MERFLVLFAREPEREAREKGFEGSAAELFSTFAAGWLVAAASAGARLVIAAPSEDLAAWRRRLPADRDILWIAQSGRTFGERLRRAAECATARDGAAVLVGGDVAPDARMARQAFEALDRGIAALSPAPDGGVSLIGIDARDVDLLGSLSAGQRAAFDSLAQALSSRGRAVAVLSSAFDVDGRSALRRLMRARVSISRSLLRRALRRPAMPLAFFRPFPRPGRLLAPTGLRAPPAFA